MTLVPNERPSSRGVVVSRGARVVIGSRARVVGVLGSSLDEAPEPSVELGAHEHHSPLAAAALQADVGADTHDLPLVGTAGMRLLELDDVAEPDGCDRDGHSRLSAGLGLLSARFERLSTRVCGITSIARTIARAGSRYPHGSLGRVRPLGGSN